jgi:proline iminopeptidase
MNEDQYTIKSGHIDVGNGHKIYYQEWGNPTATPIFFLHGGPGGGCSDKHKNYFDPLSQHIVFHDQRGSGRSTPTGSREHNTTDDLVDDIDRVRAHLGIQGPHNFFGGSWGSCLALVYAIRHPHNVEKMVLRGIYTGTKTETDYIQQGGMSLYAPETWAQYIEVVPEQDRGNTVEYYYRKMQDSDASIADDHIRRWVNNENAGAEIDSDVLSIIRTNAPLDDSTRSVALLEAHYFMNDCFLPENYIIDNAHALQHIEIVMVQGRHDHVCPPETAYKLAEKIGPSCRLHIVPGGHSGSEATMREVLRAYAWSLK